MIENIYQRKSVVSRHKEAPLLKEREQFLAHCQQQGTSPNALRNMAAELLAVVRLLRMEELREVNPEEIKQAAELWTDEQRSNPNARSYANSAGYFIFVAKKWLRFHGKLKSPSPPRARFADQLDDFVSFMATEQGLSPNSIRSHRWKTSKFLEWFTNRHRLLSSATLDDVDEFLAFKADNGWARESLSTAAQALRSFFRNVERRGGCKPGIATIYIAYRFFDFGVISGIFLHGLMPVFGELQPLIWNCGAVLTSWLFLYFLFRQKIFLRV